MSLLCLTPQVTISIWQISVFSAIANDCPLLQQTITDTFANNCQLTQVLIETLKQIFPTSVKDSNNDTFKLLLLWIIASKTIAFKCVNFSRHTGHIYKGNIKVKSKYLCYKLLLCENLSFEDRKFSLIRFCLEPNHQLELGLALQAIICFWFIQVYINPGA